MVKVPYLIPTLEAEGYMLSMPDRNQNPDVYVVRRYNVPVGKIRVNLKCVKAYTGTEVLYVPYDLDIEAIEKAADMPLDLFKKMIMATITVS